MDFCDYHPLAPATFFCGSCHTQNCDRCVDEGDQGLTTLCFSCARPMDHLGAVNQATSFWRRLEESFRYPLTAHSLFLIVGVALLTSILVYIPFTLLWYLLLVGAFLKYCFSCLEQTARGRLVAPDISEAYGGGMALLGNLLVMLLVAGATLFATYHYLGPQMGSLLAFLMVIAMPAVIIMYGMTESLLEALNPLNLMRLIAAVGLPYGLLLAFILIMSGSVGVISQLIGAEYSLLSSSLQSMAANYYTVVMFHIMGYMIFQYQGELGFTAGEDFGEAKLPRPARDRLAAQIDIRLKEGDYNDVVELFQLALRKFSSDRDFNRGYFDFLYATGRDIDRAASRYLDYLIRSQQEHQLLIIYKRVIQLKPNYRPNTAATRHRLASACKESGDSLSTAKLINGLHKEFPKYGELVEAYHLMADALEDIPQKGEQAKKCRQFAKRLAELKPQRAQGLGEKKLQAPPVDAQAPKTKTEAAPQPRQADCNEDDMEAENAGELPPIDFK